MTTYPLGCVFDITLVHLFWPVGGQKEQTLNGAEGSSKMCL